MRGQYDVSIFVLNLYGCFHFSYLFTRVRALSCILCLVSFSLIFGYVMSDFIYVNSKINK